VRRVGYDPTASRLRIEFSVHLSYRRMVQGEWIEHSRRASPALSSAYKAPLHSSAALYGASLDTRNRSARDMKPSSHLA
jgi:hypothetical protein